MSRHPIITPIFSIQRLNSELATITLHSPSKRNLHEQHYTLSSNLRWSACSWTPCLTWWVCTAVHCSKRIPHILPIHRSLDVSWSSCWERTHRSGWMTHISGQNSGGFFHLSRVEKYETYDLGREFWDPRDVRRSHLALKRRNTVSFCPKYDTAGHHLVTQFPGSN